MNFRLTLGLAIVLVVLAGAWYVTTQRGAATPQTEAKALFTPTPSITGVSLTRGSTPVMTLAQKNHTWRLTAPVNAAVDVYNVTPITDGLAKLAYQEKFTPEASGGRSLAEMGLDAPRQTVSFTTAKGATHTLELGKHTATGGIYALVDKDKTNAYVLDTDWFQSLDKDPNDLRSHTLADLSAATITGVTLVQPRQTIVAEKQGADWTITQPVTARGNAGTLDDLVNLAKGLEVTAFSDLPVSDPATGLAHPRVTLVVHGVSVTQAEAAATSPAATAPSALLTLRFGNYADLARKSVYVSPAGDTAAYIIDADLFQRADGDLLSLRDAAILPGDPTTATAVTIHRGHEHVTLERSTDGQWKMTAPVAAPADELAVTDMLSALKTLRANKFLEGAGDKKAIGLAPAQGEIALTYPGQTRQEVMLIGTPQKADPLTPVERQGEASVEMVQSGDLAKVLPGMLTLRGKTVAAFDPETVSRVELSPGTFVQKRGAQWMLTEHGRTVQADNEKVTALIDEIAPLQASAWLATSKPAGAPERLLQITVRTPNAASQAATQAAGPPAMESATRAVAFYHLDSDKPVGTAGAAQAVLQPIGGGAAWTFAPTDALVAMLRHPDLAPAAPATRPATAPATASKKAPR